ncbi:MAG: NADPH-dependent FMN reductase [Thermaurantimonas sp.]
MNILILSGATRSCSYSTMIANRLKEIFSGLDADATLTFIDNRDLQLPTYDDYDHLTPEHRKTIHYVSEHLYAADALILVSPEYNGGMAGGLKNTLDFFRKEYEWKPMGLVSVTSGTLGGQNAMNQLAAFASYVGACLSPTRLMVSQVQHVFENPDGEEAKRFEKNAEKFCSDLILFTSMIKNGLLNYSH